MSVVGSALGLCRIWDLHGYCCNAINSEQIVQGMMNINTHVHKMLEVGFRFSSSYRESNPKDYYNLNLAD